MNELIERRAGIATLLLALVSAIPLIAPQLPPLTDLPGHIGRYAVQLNLADDPLLQRYYSFDWAILPNLGVDLLIVPVSAIFGLEFGVKLIVIAAVMATVAGFVAVGRQAQRRWPVAILFALPLAYNYPFHFGFINFYCAMAAALLLFALWMRMPPTRWRALLFQPLTFLLWLCHIAGWGAFGLFAFAAEYSRHREQGLGPFASIWRGALHCLPLATPLLLMLVSPVGAVGETGNWFAVILKIHYLVMALSDRWRIFDTASVLLILVLIRAAPQLRLANYDRTLALAALLLGLAFIVTPSILVGSAYADMRLAPYALAMGLLALRRDDDAPPRRMMAFVTLSALFFAARTIATTFSFAALDADARAELAALDHVPRGARIAFLVGRSCETDWRQERKTHLGSLAIPRRSAFVNDQYPLPDAQLLRVRYEAAGRFTGDPSQMVVADDCRRPDWATLGDALRGLPRDAFDYVWLIDAPQSRRADFSGLIPVWRNGDSTLFRISRAAPRGAEPPKTARE